MPKQYLQAALLALGLAGSSAAALVTVDQQFGPQTSHAAVTAGTQEYSQDIVILPSSNVLDTDNLTGDAATLSYSLSALNMSGQAQAGFTPQVVVIPFVRIKPLTQPQNNISAVLLFGFTPTVDLSYSLTGTLQSSGGNSLSEDTSGTHLDLQGTGYSCGLAAGTCSSSGTLLAGQVYALDFATSLSTSDVQDKALVSGTFDLQLTPVPEQPARLLPLLVGAGWMVTKRRKRGTGHAGSADFSSLREIQSQTL